MAPVPLEGHQTPVGGNVSQEARSGGSVSLALLIDFMVQRTYHELTVLAELLPRKTDMERKVEIYNFSARTRQLFVRLLALVKWASSASKVDKSAHIMAFLDKQSMLLVETADMLTRIARETLTHARLPSFHIPAAVEVLTTGTYSRLPAIIRERIVPPDPITPAERRLTLLRLNQVIQHRLVTSDIRPQMRNLKIEAGRVTFIVDREFEVCLTVMGEGENIPWRLLSVKVLVGDKETGDGKPLVHSLQVKYVHDVLQSRLVDHPQPLFEVYDTLHFFCLALQLEVLYCQTLRLCRDRLDDHIRVEEYHPGKCLCLSYWRELTRDSTNQMQVAPTDQPPGVYRLTIHTDPHDSARPLAVTHLPSLAVRDAEVADRALRTNQLSIERLLIHTIYLRTKARLSELKQELQTLLRDVECQLQGSPAILSVSVLQPCLRAEQLLVTVDTLTGALLCHVPQYNAPLVPEIQLALNSDRSRLPMLISELRFWITQRRCEKTLQHLPASPHERLPLLHHADHPITKISRHKIFVRLHRHQRVILVVEFDERTDSPCEVTCNFYLAMVKPSSIEDNPDDDSVETDIPKTYLKVQSLVELDSFVVTHGPFTSVDDVAGGSAVPGSKRKSPTGRTDSPARRQKHPAYFIPELAHVVAMCDERIPFVTLAQELSRREIAHQGLQVEAGATAMVLRIVQLPTPSTLQSRPNLLQPLLKKLLSLAIRLQGKATKAWMAEFIFCGSPLQSLHPKEQGLRRPVYFQYDLGPEESIGRTVDALLRDWERIANLYALVHDLADYFQLEKYGLAGLVAVRSFSYSRLVLGYGPDRSASVTVLWSSEDKAYRLLFGATNGAVNAHSIVREQLEAHLNRHRNLAQVVALMCETYEPLVSLSKLSSLPQLGVHNSRPQVVTQGFTLVPQSPTLIKVAYQGLYCLEVRIREGGLVSIRDGSYSHLDRTHVLGEFSLTQGLKAFLSKYVDESAVFLRRRSQSEDDNPPSPVVAMESVSGGGSNPGSASTPGQSSDTNQLQNTSSPSVPSPFLAAPGGHIRPQSPATRDGTGSSGAGGGSGLRFHPPLTPPSNPHTPASPHPASGMGHCGGFSPASFSLASPPPPPSAGAAGASSGGNINPSPSMLPHPSPSPGTGGILGSASPSSSSNPLHAPSPLPMLSQTSPQQPSSQAVGHSPAGSFISQPACLGHLQEGLDHKPDLATAPWELLFIVLSNWVLLQIPPNTQRSWAGAIPTLLTHEALDLLCTPAPLPPASSTTGANGNTLEPCPLERFLGCLYLRRQLQRFIQNEECLHEVPNNEPGVVHLKTESLLCRVFQNTNHLQSLHIKLASSPDNKEQWTLEEFQIIEKFFETKVACPPYKPHTLLAFARMLNVPNNVLKDCVQIMRLELMPQLAVQQGLKWSVQWSLRIPPSAPQIVPVGVAAVLLCRTKILFFFCFLLCIPGKCLQLNITRTGVQYPPGVESPSLVLPLVYDMHSNLTQLAEKRDAGPSPATTAANLQLKRFSEYNPAPDQCSLFPAVRDLLANLTLPSEPPPMMPPGPGVNMAGQVVGSPAAMAMQSPLPQLHHSPLPAAVMGNPGVQPPGPPQQHPGYPPPPNVQQGASPMLNPHNMMPQ
ncbi:hypothetical protein B566_EDAN012686 [Ephemera danica]|nr:hypothetical protein B566_EDAN012686 [Ephemera danica]